MAWIQATLLYTDLLLWYQQFEDTDLDHLKKFIMADHFT